MSWLSLTILAAFLWGIWGVLSKLVTAKLNGAMAMLTLAIGYLIIALMNGHTKFDFAQPKYLFLGLLAGLMSGIAAVAFFNALEKGPASRIFPIASQYVVIVYILSIIFLNEPISLKSCLGVAFAVGAVILLAS
jgi:transporter family protein